MNPSGVPLTNQPTRLPRVQNREILSRQRSYTSSPGRTIPTWEKIGDLVQNENGNNIVAERAERTSSSISENSECSSNNTNSNVISPMSFSVESSTTSANHSSSSIVIYDFSIPDSEGVILYRDTDKSSVKACTFPKLIEKLTLSGPIIGILYY
jgi:hypothetical protein